MEIAITAAVAAGLAAAIAWIARGRGRGQVGVAPAAGTALLEKRPEATRRDAPKAPAEVVPTQPGPKQVGREDGHQELESLRKRVELELSERRAETVRLEERVLQREVSLEARLEDLNRREQSLADRERNADLLKNELREARHEIGRAHV